MPAMKPGQIPVRLVAEIAAIVLVTETALMLLLPVLAPRLHGLRSGLLDAALLVLLTSPLIYWRCMQATRSAALAQPRAGLTPLDHQAMARHRRRAIVLAGAAQLTGLAVTAGVVVWMKQRIDADAQVRFTRHVERLEAEMLRRFEQPVFGLKGARGAYIASRSLDRAEFRAYVESRNLPKEFPGVVGFGFVQRVLRPDLAAFIAAERADMAPDFDVRTSGTAEDLYVIKFVEPAESNRPAWGFDLGSEAVRREALERAARTGEPALTSFLVMGQGARREPGFLYLLPVYRTGSDPGTPAQRMQVLKGLMYTAMYASDLMAGVANAADQALDFELHHGDGRDARNIVYRSAAPGGATAGAAAAAAAADAAEPMFQALRPLKVGGRTLTLAMRSSAAFDASVERAALRYVALGGALLSLLAALTVWSLAASRLRALTLAQRMTADLDRLAKVVQHTSNAVTITDRRLQITWVNAGFTRITGYSLDEALGRTPGELLGSGRADAAALQTLAEAVRAGAACRVEILNRAKDGREYWIDTEVQPLRDAHGRVTGFMEIGSDITDKRQASERLEAAMAELATERQRLDNILRGTDVGTWEWHVASGVTRINARWATMLGYRHEELDPVSFDGWTALVHADDLPGARARLDRHLAGDVEDYQCELRLRHRQGHWVWVLTRGRVIARGPEGEPLDMAGTHMDITLRKQAEQAMADTSRRLDNILRGTAVGTVEWNVATGQMRLNERWAAMHGYAPGELPPMTIERWLAMHHPEDQARANALLRRHFRGETEGFEAEMRSRHKDGHWVWLLHRGSLISRTADGRPEWMTGTQMDISARKAAEAERQRITERMAVIIENLPCGLSVFDEDLKLVACNTEFRRLLQLPDALLTAPGTPFERIIRWNAEHGAYGEVDIDYTVHQLVERARHPVPHHFERTRPDGITLEVRGVPLPGGGFVTTYNNVTERKQAEAAIHESEHLMRLVMDSIPGRLTYFDRERRLKFANKASYGFYGGTPETSAGVAFEDFVGTPFAEPQRERVDAVLAGQAQSYDFERTLPDGDKAYSVVHLIPDLREGRVHGFVGMAIDVSAVKRAEAEVRRAEALLRGAIDAVNEAFVLYDADDRLVFCNDKYRELYAASADLIVPGATFEHIIRTGAERGQYADAVGRVDEWVAERMAAHRVGNTTLVQKIDGGRWLRIIERRMPDGHIVGFRIDITDLMNATEAAEAASRAKSRFLANMSHEIRTPMNAILGMLRLLRRTPLTPRQLDYADKTERAARALLGLLNDILDFSKIEAGKLTLDPRPFRLDQLMRDLSVILSANLGHKPVEVLYDIDPQVPRALVGDDLRLQQVLINLGGNAIKFTEAGEVVIGVQVQQRDAAGVRLAFSVRDTGIGIAPEHQQHIFDGFSQAESSTTRRFGGTGLGLSICQRLVTLMGGEIHMDSTPGVGSTFSFALDFPVADDATAQPGDAPRADAGALRVLVVDDNPSAREVLATMSRSLGWTVDLAEGGEQAVALVQRRLAEGLPYQGVFVDWQMPGLDGWETSQRIHQLAGAQAPLLMMVTAHGRARLAERPAAEQALLSGYLVKPVTASMLLDAVVDARARRGQPHPSRPTQPVLAAPRLAGVRLLVVEDNLNNQQVAQELLQDEGALVSLAADGAQGVAAVAAARPPFDAVLMDLQMPVMDGYTATSHIRQRLGPAQLPIIAMTANALASDRAACLAAGMNDHVGKPFDLDELVATLKRHLPAGAGSAPGLPPPAPPTADTVSTADAPPNPPPAAPRHPPTPLPPALLDEAQRRGIGLAAAVGRLSGRADVYLRLAESFARTLAGSADELQALLAAGQREDAARQLHSLKGLSATLGAQALATLCAAGEQLLAQPAAPGAAQDEQALPDRLRALAEQTRQDLLALAAALGTALAPAATNTAATTVAATGAGGTAADRQALAQQLDSLMALLREADMAATDAFAALQRSPLAPPAEALAALAGAMAELDFEQALRECATLRRGLPA